MHVLNAADVAGVAGGGKPVDPSAGTTPLPPLAPRPRPWPWVPVEP